MCGGSNSQIQAPVPADGCHVMVEDENETLPLGVFHPERDLRGSDRPTKDQVDEEVTHPKSGC